MSRWKLEREKDLPFRFKIYDFFIGFAESGLFIVIHFYNNDINIVN